MAVAWESTTGQALAAYATGADAVRYRTWNGTWSGEQTDGPDVGHHTDALTLDADPNVVPELQNMTLWTWGGGLV